MPDAQDLYEQHDDLQERANDLRNEFTTDVKNLNVTWDAEEHEIDQRFNKINERLEKTHELINDLQQIEIDRVNADEIQNDNNLDRSKDLIEKCNFNLTDIEYDLIKIAKYISDWRDTIY